MQATAILAALSTVSWSRVLLVSLSASTLVVFLAGVL